MLEISRPDVVSDHIVSFPVEARFIKLPVVPYLKLLGVFDTMNTPQIALVNAINDPQYRFICAAYSRRLGKTYISNIIAQLITLMPGSNILIMSPNYSLSTISFELQRSFIRHFDIEIERDNLKDRVIELANGSTVRMGSVSTVDSVLGRSYDAIIFDEAAISSKGEDAFNVQLRPTLDKPGSKCIFISTPRGRLNWFSRFHSRGYSPDFPQWCSLTADYHENTRSSEADISEAKNSMSKSEFAQEYLASFNTFEGQIFEFDRDVCVTELPVFPEGTRVEFIAGLDPGYKDPTAFAVIAYYTEEDSEGVERDIFHIVDEYLASGVTSKHAAAFQVFIDKWDIDLIFIDSAAAQFGADLTYEYDITTSKSKKEVLPGISYVQAIVEQDCLRIASHCKHSLAAMDQYRWDPKDGLLKPKAVHDIHSHMSDAIRYSIYTFTT